MSNSNRAREGIVFSCSVFHNLGLSQALTLHFFYSHTMSPDPLSVSPPALAPAAPAAPTSFPANDPAPSCCLCGCTESSPCSCTEGRGGLDDCIQTVHRDHYCLAPQTLRCVLTPQHCGFIGGVDNYWGSHPEPIKLTCTWHRVFNKGHLDTDYFTLRNWALNLQT